MARQSKPPTSAKILPDGPLAPGALKLTKQDVLERELRAALRLFLYGEDPVAIHVLVSAAHEIISVLAKARGEETMAAKVEQRLDPDYLDDWRRRRNAAYNFMKHAGRDASAEHDFHPGANEILLFDAILSVDALFGRFCFEALLFLGWIGGVHPELAPKNASWLQSAVTGLRERDPKSRLREAATVLRLWDQEEGGEAWRTRGPSS